MSKVIKQMEMTALKKDFDGVRDMVVLSVKGLSCHADHTFRAALRKKKIRLKVVKNSLTRRVFEEMGIPIDKESPYWAGPTAMAWGAGSIAELSRELDGELKHAKNGPMYKDKVKVKGAIFDGQLLPFEKALKMPTKMEAFAKVASMILAPASRVLGQILAPGSRVTGQIQSLKDKPEPAAQPAPA
jgi:large subunit ribosomal protein L10